MNITDNQSIRQLALLIVISVFGITGSYMLSTSIQEKATKTWHERGQYDARQMTNRFVSWLDEVYGPVRALSVLFENSSSVSNEEFEKAVNQLATYRIDYFPEAFLYLEQENNKWIIKKLTDNEHGFETGQTLDRFSGAIDGITSAYKHKGELMMGPTEPLANGNYYTFASLSVNTKAGVGIVTGVVNINELDQKISAVIPKGMGFSVSSRHTSGVETEARDHLYPEGSSSANAKALFKLAARAGGTDLYFNWGITDAYQGGSFDTLARVILISGILITIIITIFIRFLLSQQSKTQRIVDQQTELHRSSERRLKEVTNNMPGAVYQLLEQKDDEVNFTFISEGVSELFGIGKIDESINLESVFRYMHEEDIPRISESLSSARNKLTPWFEEYRVQVPNQSQIWIENGAVPKQLDDGSILWNGYWRDITEQKEMQERVMESEYRYQSALDAANVGLWDIDMEHNRTTFNDQYYRMLGYEPEDFEGGEHLQGIKLTHPDDLEKLNLEEEMYSVNSPDDYQTEIRMISKNGEYRNILAIGKIISRDSEGKPLRCVGVQFDITDQKNAEQQLRISEERFQLAMESANIGVWDVDMVTGIAHYNEQYFKMLGYDRGEFEDNHENWTDLIHPDDLERSKVNADKLTTGKVERSENEFRMIASNGEEITILSIGTVISRDKNNKPTRILGVHVDVNESKKSELVIKEKMTELELFNKVAVGRELRMINLKQEVNKLLNGLGKENKYEIID
jgi:PAS domain S-box-containing protein